MKISVEEYLSDPSGKNLVALGKNRNQILLDYLANSGRERQDSEGRVGWVVDTVAMFAKVTRDYHSCMTLKEKDFMTHMEHAIGQSFFVCVCPTSNSFLSRSRCSSPACLPRMSGLRADQ